MNYCSNCAAPVKHIVPPDDDRRRFVCQACGVVHYQNPRLVVGSIPVWQDKILLCLRDIEPRRGKWTLPAGYLENGETVKEGARRETHEETGAKVVQLERTKESAEVRLFSEREIPWDEIAFPVIEETLERYIADRAKGAFPFQVHQILVKMKRD